MKRDERGRGDGNLQIVNHIFIVRDRRQIEFSLLQDFVHQYDSIRPSDAVVRPPPGLSEQLWRPMIARWVMRKYHQHGAPSPQRRCLI